MKLMHRLTAAFALVVGMLMLAVPTGATAAGISDYLENKLTDHVLRGQTFTPAAALYVGLSTSACSDSATGTEVSGGSYARARYPASGSAAMADWAGTQSGGSTSASSGTGGQTSNNNAVSFATPSAGWGTVTHFFITDAVSGAGNLYFCASLSVSKAINSGDTVTFPAGSITITVTD